MQVEINPFDGFQQIIIENGMLKIKDEWSMGDIDIESVEEVDWYISILKTFRQELLNETQTKEEMK